MGRGKRGGGREREGEGGRGRGREGGETESERQTVCEQTNERTETHVWQTAVMPTEEKAAGFHTQPS